MSDANSVVRAMGMITAGYRIHRAGTGGYWIISSNGKKRQPLPVETFKRLEERDLLVRLDDPRSTTNPIWGRKRKMKHEALPLEDVPPPCDTDTG